MALDTARQQNGVDHASGAEADPAEQTAIEEASVIHLLRVLVAEAAPPPKVSEDAMEHDSPSVTLAEDINDVTCEEAGCLLWDMSASRPVARVMLRNRALEALEIVIARELQVVHMADRAKNILRPQVTVTTTATPTAGEGSSSPEDRQNQLQQQRQPQQYPPSPPPPPPQQQQQPELQQLQQQHRIPNTLRILEICLGTLANLVVTQSSAAVAVSNRPELLALLLLSRSSEDDDPDGAAVPSGGGALYVDDARVLSELFRLFSLALRCQGSAVWLSSLSAPTVLQRIMWVGAATADAQLFTRFLDMVVALLHAASGSASGTGDESGGGTERPVAGVADRDPDSDVAAVDGHGGVAQPATGPACCRVLLECGLMELLHQVLLQTLRGCMPAAEKYNELGGEDAEAFVSPGNNDRRTGPSPPSIVGGPAAAFAGNLAAAGRVSDASTLAAADVITDITPRSDGSCRFGRLPDTSSSLLDTVTDDTLCGAAGSGSCGQGAASPGDAAAAAIWAGAAATATATAVATSGPVPLSDEAVDAALRLIEELVSPSGPLMLLGERPDSHGRSPRASGGSNGAEMLLQLHEERGLRPGLMQLLLGLLRYQYDSIQVIEGLLVLLVDLGNAVPGAVAASSPDAAAAAAARLVELLQDSSFSPAQAASQSTLQLQQGAWYLLAATLRGALAAVAIAGADAPPGCASPLLIGVAPPDTEKLGRGSQPRAHTSSGVPALVPWGSSWPSLERSLYALPELPRPDGCLGYVRACCVAGLQLLEELWGLQLSEMAGAGEKQGLAPDDGGDEQGQEGGDRSQRSSETANACRAVTNATEQENGVASNEELLVRLGCLLRGMLKSLHVPAS